MALTRPEREKTEACRLQQATHACLVFNASGAVKKKLGHRLRGGDIVVSVPYRARRDVFVIAEKSRQMRDMSGAGN